jgi:ATP-dependent protease ClpP protease subunit
MIYRVTPRIVALQNEGRDPITLYIDSRGGAVHFKNSLLRLLTASNQHFEGPCLLITVAMSLAASAAADLLSAGIYSLAYPDSLIMYHGVRRTADEVLTEEQTYQLAHDLREGNKGFAIQLARDTEERFFFRFMSLYELLPAVKARGTITGGDTDLEAFLTLLAEKTSESANEVLQKAYERYRRYAALINCVVKNWTKAKKQKTFVELEVAQIKAIVDFEARKNKAQKGWRFETEGIHTLIGDFFLVNEFLGFFEGKRFRELVLRWGGFLLSAEETAELDKLDGEAKDQKTVDIVGPRLRPVFSYFMALCHILQQGDNYLSAKDAFWLGLIDEVIGVKELPTYRLFVEHAKDVEKEEANKAADGGAVADAAAGA